MASNGTHQQYERVRQQGKEPEGTEDHHSRHSGDASNDESFETADDGLDRRSLQSDPRTMSPLTHAAFSFDFDDDEEDLQRYRFESDRLSASSPMAHPSHRPASLLAWAPYLWKVYMETRLERRQQRTQQLLNAHTKQQRCQLGFSSWCDLYDRGWSLWLAIVVIWIFSCRFYRSERSFLIGLGVPLLLLRFSWQPLSVYFRRSQRARQSSWDPIAKPSEPADHWDRPAYRDRDESAAVEMTNNGSSAVSETSSIQVV